MIRVLEATQLADVGDPVRAKLAMVVPVLEATLLSVNRARLERLGGIAAWTLHDLARENREGDGDSGICFEFAVHEAIASGSGLIYPLASEVLETHCKIDGGAHSILFGPEKNGVIPIVESVQDALTDDSRVYVGNRGNPPKLKKYIPQIVNAFHRNEERNKLPRSINGLWKADLFVGNSAVDKWVGTTVKINPANLVGAQGLRIGIYPKLNRKDIPRRDYALNLIRLPLPYDAAFMELFYKSFFLVRQFLRADAKVPDPSRLPDAEDRFLTKELQDRRDLPLLDVLDGLRVIAQPDLLKTQQPRVIMPDAMLSGTTGLTVRTELDVTTEADAEQSMVSLAPEPKTD